MEEIWKNIKDYEGIYQISNMGNIRSLDRVVKLANGNERHIKGKMLRIHMVSGYLMVSLYKNGKRSNILVHRLVASNFLKNEKNLPEVNHIDHCKTNNKSSNLEWCTRDYNIRDMTLYYKGAYKNSKGLYKEELNTCPFCKKVINYNSNFCKKCNNEISKSYRISKDDIITSLTKNKGNFTKSSKDFDLSDNALRKWCRKYSLPTSSKYWKLLTK